MKPPLGLTPSFVYKRERINEIIEAMNRYIQAEYPIPVKWIEEYNELVEGCNKRTPPTGTTAVVKVRL